MCSTQPPGIYRTYLDTIRGKVLGLRLLYMLIFQTECLGVRVSEIVCVACCVRASRPVPPLVTPLTWHKGCLHTFIMALPWHHTGDQKIYCAIYVRWKNPPPRPPTYCTHGFHTLSLQWSLLCRPPEAITGITGHLRCTGAAGL